MVGRGKLLDQRFWGIETSIIPIPFARKWLKSSLQRIPDGKLPAQSLEGAQGHAGSSDIFLWKRTRKLASSIRFSSSSRKDEIQRTKSLV
jgi:hypothetical protein